MFFAIIPTVVYEVLDAQAALLTDCSLATYGRSGTAARPKWPLGLGFATDWPWVRVRHRLASLGFATEVASWQAPQLGPCASSGPALAALAGSGWLWLAQDRLWLSQASVRPTVRPAGVASKADVTACGHPTTYCHPMTYCHPTYNLLPPRLRPTATPPMAIQASPPSRRSVCGARAVPSEPTVRCLS